MQAAGHRRTPSSQAERIQIAASDVVDAVREGNMPPMVAASIMREASSLRAAGGSSVNDSAPPVAGGAATAPLPAAATAPKPANVRIPGRQGSGRALPPTPAAPAEEAATTEEDAPALVGAGADSKEGVAAPVPSPASARPPPMRPPLPPAVVLAAGFNAGSASDGRASDSSTSSASSGRPATARRKKGGIAGNGAGSGANGGCSGTKNKSNAVVCKVGMVGDAGVGKTSLMVKYIEGKFDEDYIQTLGVNFMEKTISLKQAEITFSARQPSAVCPLHGLAFAADYHCRALPTTRQVWDLAGQREFLAMLPLVCNDAYAILFMFDLSRRSTLGSVKEWYRQVRGLNKNAFAFLVGTKYDQYRANTSAEYQRDVLKQARKFARAMKAPLIFSSAAESVNIKTLFKIVFSKVFAVKCRIPRVSKLADGAIVEF